MTKQIRSTLKGYFETGDVPTQQNYADLIDSKVNLTDTEINPQIISTGISASYLTSNTHITASGIISASDALFGNRALIAGHITASGDVSGSSTGSFEYVIAQNEYLEIFTRGHITASGNISASGNIIATQITGSFTGDINFEGDAGKVNKDGTILALHVTASQNISASGNIIGNQITGSDSYLKSLNVGGMTIQGDTVTGTAGYNMVLDSPQDIILDAAGDQIYLKNAGTTIFTFNVDSTPELDVKGNLIIDPDGGDVTFSGANINIEGHVTASGNISGSIASTGSFGLILGDNTGGYMRDFIPVLPTDLTVASSGTGQVIGDAGNVTVSDSSVSYSATYMIPKGQIARSITMYSDAADDLKINCYSSTLNGKGKITLGSNLEANSSQDIIDVIGDGNTYLIINIIFPTTSKAFMGGKIHLQ